MIVPATLLLTAGILVFDLLTPLGGAEWCLYVIPLLLGFYARPRKFPLVLAGTATFTIAIGFFWSPPPTDPQWELLNRGVGAVVLWLTAFLLVKSKNAELALKNSEQRLRAILDHAPLAIFLKDLEGRYTEFSRQCELDTGCTRESALGRTDEELFPAEIKEMYVTTDQAAIKAGGAVQNWMTIPHSSGARTNLVIKFPLYDPDGNRTALGGVSADITELEQAETAARESRERLDLAQMAANMGTYEYILSGQTLHWSPAMFRLYGMAPAAAGGDLSLWIRLVHPEDLARVERERLGALADQQEFRTEYRIVRPDGEIRWVKSISKIFRDSDGRPERLVGINVDITDQKAGQEAIAFSNGRLGLIAQVSASAIGSCSLREESQKLAEQVMTAFNFDGCVVRTLEGERLDLLANAGMLRNKIQPIMPADGEIFRTVRNSRAPVFVPDALNHPGMREFVRQLAPSDRFMSYAGAPLLVQSQVIGIVGIYSRRAVASFSETDLGHLQIVANHIAVAIANDRLLKEVRMQSSKLAQEAAERETAQEALRQTTEQLQILSRRLLELQEAERRHISRELHDQVGQALTALKINLQAVLRIAEPNETQPRLLDSIDIVDRTLGLVRNLSLDLRPSMLDDLGLTAALRWYADQQAQRAGLRVQFFACGLEDGRLDPGLETSCFRIAQEALTNVVRHARASSAMVELRRGNEFLHLLVRDDGVGFDLSKTRDRLQDGASLGLLGMEERASLAGGRLELKSAPDAGTEVHVWFPLAGSSRAVRETTGVVKE